MKQRQAMPLMILFITLFTSCSFLPDKTSYMLDSGWELTKTERNEGITTAESKIFVPVKSIEKLSIYKEKENEVLWVKKEFSLPKALTNTDMALLLGGVSGQITAFLNGDKLSETGHFYTDGYFKTDRWFSIHVPFSVLKFRKKNELILRVDGSSVMGIGAAPRIGVRADIEKSSQTRNLLNLGIIFMTAVLMLIFSIQSFRMKHVNNNSNHVFYFGLLSLSIFMWSLSLIISEVSLFPENMIFASAMISTMASFFALFLLFEFTRRILDQKVYNAIGLINILFTIAVCLLHAVVPQGNMHEILYRFTFVFYIVFILEILVVLFFALKKEERYSLKILFLFIISTGLVIYDAINKVAINNTEAVTWFVLFIPLLAVMLERISNARSNSEFVELDHQISFLEGSMQKMSEDLGKTEEEGNKAKTELQRNIAATASESQMIQSIQKDLFSPAVPSDEYWEAAFFTQTRSTHARHLIDFYADKGSLDGLCMMESRASFVESGILNILSGLLARKSFVDLKERKLGTIMKQFNKKLLTEVGNLDNSLTGVMLRFDSDQLEYVNAGHPDILYKNSSMNRVSMVTLKEKDTRGLDLGVEGLQSEYIPLKLKTAESDLILIYSDSLINGTHPETSEVFGLDRLMDSIQDAPVDSAQKALDFVMLRYFSFMKTHELHDDLTVVMVRKK